jgi:hypothetical protein
MVQTSTTYLVPDELVQSGVNSDILGSHGLLSKLLDLANSLWGLLLEGAVGDAVV